MKLKRNLKYLLIISLLLIPQMVFASGGNDGFPLGFALAMEAFVSIHMSVFVLKPLADIFAKENSKKAFWILFLIRAVFLIFCDLFVTPGIAIVDFLSVFIGAAIIVPVCAAATNTKIDKRSNRVIRNQPVSTLNNSVNEVELKCSKCNSVLQVSDNFCSNCGAPVDGKSAVVSENTTTTQKTETKKNVLTPTNFNSIYSLSEDKMLEEFITNELTKVGIDKSTKLIPSDMLKRKKILNLIFSVLVMVYIMLIFFHFPISTYVVGIIILFIFFRITRKYDFIKYLTKQIKTRPGEKISNIVMYEKNNLLTDNTKTVFLVSILVAVVLPLIVFSSPRVFYEKTDGGYAVRYYTFGLTNFKTVTIPKYYKKEKVVSLRGNTFSNMPFLEKVSLPDSIVEIRGQAFKNCINLTQVNIPSKLKYLGGGAFYNASSIKRIELPDTLTYLGGESFYGATSLEYVKLSNNLSEIRGDSFEYCSSLKSIVIPDNVTRIGGHAFYGDRNLSEVIISENSKLSMIGSSAFRQCFRLYNIIIPSDTYVNERAFKESPTSVSRYGDSYDSSSYSNSNYYYNN